MLFAAICLALGARPAVADEAPPMRLAVVVGANIGQSHTAPLRYAHDDARRVATLLTELGGFGPGDVSTHLDADPNAVLDALDTALDRAAAAPGALLVFYFSGHADADALYVGGQPLPTAALRARLADSRATVRVGIVDACAGGEWTGTKGLAEAPVFDVSPTLGLDSEGTVLLASSSGAESAHELEHLGGSLFTHHLLAGLRGAADVERDGDISLDEAFTYARYRTIRDAGRLVKHPQHPSFRFDLSGRRALTLTRPRLERGAVVLSGLTSPTDVLDLDRGAPVVDLPEAETPIRLVLPPGRYLLRRLDPARPASAEFTVAAGTPVELTEADLVPTPDALGRGKGSRPLIPSLTLPGGAIELGVSIGGSASDHDGDGRFTSGGLWLSSLSGHWGVTDRLEYQFPLAAAYRFGRRDGFEFSPHAGLYGLQFNSGSGWLALGGLGGGARWALGPRLALGARVSGTAGLSESKVASLGARATASLALAPVDWLTITLGAGGSTLRYRTTLWIDWETSETNVHTDRRLLFGGVDTQEPLLRFHISEVVSLTIQSELGLYWNPYADGWGSSVSLSGGVRLRF